MLFQEQYLSLENGPSLKDIHHISVGYEQYNEEYSRQESHSRLLLCLP